MLRLHNTILAPVNYISVIFCYNRAPPQREQESLNSHLVPWFHEAKSSLSTEVSRNHQVSLPAGLWVVLRLIVFKC